MKNSVPQYSFMLLFLFIAEVILSTVAFVFPGSFLAYFKEGLTKDLVMRYREDTNLQNLIDSMHTGLKCCGISDKGYKDWSQNIYFNCSATNPSPERCGVPYSCCRNAKNLDVCITAIFLLSHLLMPSLELLCNILSSIYRVVSSTLCAETVYKI